MKVSGLQIYVGAAVEELLQALLPDDVPRHPEQTLHMQIWEQADGTKVTSGLAVLTISPTKVMKEKVRLTSGEELYELVDLSDGAF